MEEAEGEPASAGNPGVDSGVGVRKSVEQIASADRSCPLSPAIDPGMPVDGDRSGILSPVDGDRRTTFRPLLTLKSVYSTHASYTLLLDTSVYNVDQVSIHATMHIFDHISDNDFASSIF